MYQRFSLLFKKILQKIFSKRKKPFVYVALGDSTVEGYGATKPERGYVGIIYHALQERYPKAVFHNLGVSNSTVADVLEKQVPQAIVLQPDLVTISIGGNDVRFHTPIKYFEKYLKEILEKLSTQTNADIVINTIPDFSLLPVVPKHLKTLSKVVVWRFNRKIITLAQLYSIILVDLFRQGRVFAKHYPEVMHEDGFHPSDFGYAIWANTILGSIQPILRKRTFW